MDKWLHIGLAVLCLFGFMFTQSPNQLTFVIINILFAIFWKLEEK